MAKHVWGSWGPWELIPGTTNRYLRERHCLDATCGETETQYWTTDKDPNG